MLLVEQHVIPRRDPRFDEMDRAAFASKNLYNAATYVLRQAFTRTCGGARVADGQYISYTKLDKRLQAAVEYCALPRKVSQWVLRQLDHDLRAFFAAAKAYLLNPATFTSRPKLPKYKHKQAGRNLLTYTPQALSRKSLKQNLIHPSGLAIEIQTRHPKHRQVRIVHPPTHYTPEAVSDQSPQPLPPPNPPL